MSLRKEIKEEYMADVLGYEFLGFRDVHREKEGVRTHWIALDFKVLVDREEVRIGEPEKFDEIGWFTIDNLQDKNIAIKEGSDALKGAELCFLKTRIKPASCIKLYKS